MRKLYNPNSPQNKKSITSTARNMSIEHNVVFNVIDLATDKIVQTHESHNAATNSLLTGIGHYLMGNGVFNQAYDMLSRYVPRYISLGTMGLINQDEDENGLPVGLGGFDDTMNDSDYYNNPEINRICHYASQCPGYGADGYQANQNNGRPYFGLGPIFDKRTDKDRTINCELISNRFPRVEISFRDIVPEYDAEIPKTIDIIYSGMISTGALAQFREPDKDYIFITEAGLWSTRPYSTYGDNGLLAGYRIVPPNQVNWNFGTFIKGEYDDAGNEVFPDHYVFQDSEELPEDQRSEEIANKQRHNIQLLKENVLRVARNQVVQVIWKIQIGGLEQLGGMSELYPNMTNGLIWELWDNIE